MRKQQNRREPWTWNIGHR